MQAGLSKAERRASVAVRAAVRPFQRSVRREARAEAKRTALVQAVSWESVAKVYAAPEHIAKTKAIHKQQCESLRAAKANGEVQSRRWKLEPPIIV